MTSLDDPRQRTVDAVYRAIEANRFDWRRPHLGASQLGKPCDRQVWYGFRWVQAPEHPGRILALFERGEREEQVQFSRLRSAGVEVWSVDPTTGRQFTVDLGPHMGGSMDGIVLGLLEAPKTPHVIDVKTASKKQFDKLLKVGVREWNFGYYTQLQMYMHDPKHDINRAVLWVVCKDDDRLYMERFEYDRRFATQQVERGQRIIFADSPPSRISEDPSWYECKFCDYHATCQAGQIAKLQRNCRSCAHSTPRDDGTWHCDKFDKSLTVPDQKAGCDYHVFHPGVMPRGWNAVDSDGASVTYVDARGEEHVDNGGEVRCTAI